MTTVGTRASRPDAELAVGKVLSDAGAGLNSDLIGAMEWAATPATGTAGLRHRGPDREYEPRERVPAGAPEHRQRLRPGQRRPQPPGGPLRDAVRGSRRKLRTVHRQPARVARAAAQALSVAASAKDLGPQPRRHAVGRHLRRATSTRATPPAFADNTCDQGPGRSHHRSRRCRPAARPVTSGSAPTSPPRVTTSCLPRRRAAPRSTPRTSTSGREMTRCTPQPAARPWPRRRPRAARRCCSRRTGTAYGTLPRGASGTSGLPTAPWYALVRAALHEHRRRRPVGGAARRRRTTSARWRSSCAGPPAQVPFLCDFINVFDAGGNATVYEVRNGPSDRFVGPLGEGAGRVRIGPAIAALRDGVVIYSAASGTGRRGRHRPARPPGQLAGWRRQLPAPPRPSSSWCRERRAPPGREGQLRLPAGQPVRRQPRHPDQRHRRLEGRAPARPPLWLPAAGTPGSRSGSRSRPARRPASTPAWSSPPPPRATTLRIPVMASVADALTRTWRPGNAPGVQARASLTDVFAKADTIWPSVLGSTGTGASSDWNVYPVELRQRPGPRRVPSRRHSRPERDVRPVPRTTRASTWWRAPIRVRRPA